MKPVITVNQKKCVGCRICELACSLMRTKALNPQKSYIRVNVKPNGTVGVEMFSGCTSCQGEPLCVDLCPTGALSIA